MNVIKYLSFSSMTTFEMSPEKWVEQYLHGNKQKISRNMAYGTQLADGMENNLMTGDPVLDLIMSKLPKYDLSDKVIEDKKKGVEILNPHDGKKYTVPFIQNGKEKIPLVAKPDSSKSDYSAFYEYKTSTTKWTDKKVSESGQITFYATAVWAVTGEIPKDIELINVRVDYKEDGSLAPTGDILRFKTSRNIIDVIKMTKRIRSAWKSIGELCEKELL